MQKLPVMEHFYTIQGEGVHAGRPAYFVRLAGCDVGCVWCDVKESWQVSKEQYVEVEEIVQWVQQSNTEIVVITGGEPAMYDLGLLTQSLQQKGYKTHIETSGAYKITGHWDHVCLSPKKFKAPLKENMPLADELKVVVFNQSDFDWAVKHADHVSEYCILILNPEWEKREKVMPLMIEFVKSNPQFRIGLQTHKYINVP